MACGHRVKARRGQAAQEMALKLTAFNLLQLHIMSPHSGAHRESSLMCDASKNLSPVDSKAPPKSVGVSN